MNVEPDALFDEASNVTTRSDFIVFLRHLNTDYIQNRESWSNDTLSTFLDGLSAFADDMGGYYENMGENVNVENISWRMAAQMLLAATLYGA